MAKTKYRVFYGAALIPILAGCASNPIALLPVEPEPLRPDTYIPKGQLQVYSDVETHEIGDDTFYYPHKPYSVHDDSGRIVKFVSNHMGDTDESPARVTIPAGRYNIVAESSSYGRVTVPVVIQQDRTTVVHLDGAWKPSSSTSSNEVVRLPDGEAIGWK